MIPDGLPRHTIEANRRRFGTFSWQGQAPQYDQLGPKGEIVYRQFFDNGVPINTLLAYDPQWGQLIGFLNHYPYEVVDGAGQNLQRAQSVNMFLHPDLSNQDRKALFKVLMDDAKRRWPERGEADEADLVPSIQSNEIDVDPSLLRTQGLLMDPSRTPMDGNHRVTRIGRRS